MKRPLRTCPHCNEEFEPERNNQKYCKPEHRKAAYRQRKKTGKQQPPKHYLRECSNCGEEYKAKKRPKPDEPGYCSDPCRSAADRQRREFGEPTRSSYGPEPENERRLWCSTCQWWMGMVQIDEQGNWRATCSCGRAYVAPPSDRVA